MFTNPALAADHQQMNFSLNNKSYTNKQFSTYNLTQFTLIYPFDLVGLITSNQGRPQNEHISGAGFSVYREAEGTSGQFTTVGAMFSMAHNIQLDKAHYLSLGLQGGFTDIRSNNDFQWGTQYDPIEGYNENILPSLGDIDLKKFLGNVNAGICWFFNNSRVKDEFSRFKFDAFAGFSVYNINRPNQSFFEGEETRVPMNYKFHGGLKFGISETVAVFPNVLLVNQNNNNLLNVGSFAALKPNTKMFPESSDFSIIAGVYYIVDKSVVTTLGFKVYTLSFGASYDFNASSFKYNNRGQGTLEFSLKYAIPDKDPDVNRGRNYPTFF